MEERRRQVARGGTIRRTVAVLVAVFPLVGAASAVSAQESDASELGRIHGVVFGGESGEPLEGAEVETDDGRSMTTNQKGGVSVEVPAGTHTLTVQAPGGERAVVDGVGVQSGETSEVIVEFREGEPPQVDVREPEKSVDSTSAEEGGEQRIRRDADPGTVRGRVASAEDGEAVEGARVIVRGVKRGAKTDGSGRFELELPPGRHGISIIHSEFSTASRDGVEVETGETTEISFELAPASVRLSSYEVTIPRLEGSTVNMVEKKRESAAAKEVIGAEQFSKSGDSTAAGALKRVTGLTVVGGKYVYVRGMGSRYSSSLLNGSTLPSPEPNKRVVPLDMFPTSILANVTVHKTYTADLPGNFGGGTVDMETTSYPEEFTYGLSLSLGGATDTTFREGLTYEGGSLDWLGVGDGSREIPDELAEATDGKALSKKDRFGRGNFTEKELETLGETLPNNWNAERETMVPDLGVGVEVGDSFDIGGATAGFRLAGTYDYSHDTDRYTEKTFATSDDGLRAKNTYDFFSTTEEIVASAILTGGVEFDENHSLKLTSTLNRVTDDEARRYEGFYGDLGSDIRVTRLRWVERQLWFNQLRGEHTFPEAGGLEVDWNYVYSQARRREPDRRQYRYDYSDKLDGFALSDRPEGNSRLWSNLVDDNHDARVSVRWPFRVWNDLEASLEAGFAGRRKDREVRVRRFKFANRKTSLDVFRRRPEAVFTKSNIGPDSYFELTEVTRATDNYRGGQTVLAGYAKAKVPIVDSLQLNGGVRLEHSRQRVETFALFSDQSQVGQLKTTDVLPAFNLKWKFLDDMQVRAAAARTVNRPNLRELSDARFTDVVGGREFRGNPELNRALLTHYDARWEWYPERGESLSVGAFYKDFEDPIELTFRPGATPVVKPANVQGARNYGVEFQGRTSFDFLSKTLRNLYVSGNLSLIRSRVQIDPDSDEADILTSTERPLQGQSPYVVNTQLSYDNTSSGTTASLIYHVFGPRVTQVGIYGIPNVVEQPYHTLDLTFSQKLDNGFEISAEAGNILNLPHRYTQGDQVKKRQYEGRSFSVGVTWSPE